MDAITRSDVKASLVMTLTLKKSFLGQHLESKKRQTKMARQGLGMG
jgi:hypothetical protein